MTTFFRADQGSITLIRETPSRIPFAKATQAEVPFADWLSERPDKAAAAVARIIQADGDGETGRDGTLLVLPTGNGITLHADLVASLSDGEAQALGLPPATRLALNLRSSGLLHRAGFRIEPSWTRAGGVPADARQKGVWLRATQQDWRIPEPLWSTLAAAEAVNDAVDEAGRQEALARLKTIIGEDAAAQIRPDGIIERLRLHYASGFSLTLHPSAAGIDFDPVLFARQRLDMAESGEVLDEQADSLLPPTLAQGFARRFRSGDGTRRSYLLDDGSILYVDPQLSQALGVVRQAQSGSAEQRRTFIAAPERHIAEALGTAGAGDEDARRLFVETQQFSERVAGIDIWRKPVLPWIKPKPNSWLPESFGLRVGEPPDERSITIAPEKLEYAIAAATEAQRLHEATFAFEGETIPATQATLAALTSLGELRDAVANEASDSETPPATIRERYFLQVRDNLDDLAFAPLPSSKPPSELLPETLPEALKNSPKPHQIAGFRWLTDGWRSGMPGALLADDMGLGKTYQALAFLAWIRSQPGPHRPVLIVAPTGLLANWRAEIVRHLEPDTLGRVVNAYGSELSRMRAGAGRDIDSGAAAIDADVWSHAGVVLTTFETMRDYHMSFARQPFTAILYDEAQKLKNPSSQVTRAAKTLNARFQLALTGTPVENRLQDLWSILDVVHPGLLGSSKAFEQAYPAEPDKLRELHSVLTEPRDGRPAPLLRRLKDECLDSLPAKHVRALPMPMPPAQAAAYDQAIARALVVKGTGQRGRMLEVLHRLRGVSLHPVEPEAAGGNPAYFSDSARLDTLFATLKDIATKGEKVLIFCESLAMQALLAAEIQRRHSLGHPVPRINGGVAGDARQQIVDTFQSRGAGFDAMILSPKAGGVGLTLTAANHVIHLSRWWNPAVEDQATDRAYRIGQGREVTVYLPQAVHPDPAIRPTSFDLKLHELMERKRTLSRGLFTPADDESDADALFDSVVVEKPQAAQQQAGAALDQHSSDASPPPAPSLTRRLLSPRPPSSVPNTEPDAPLRRKSVGPPRVVYQAGAPRDHTIFTAPTEGDPIERLFIVDPYAAAEDRNRAATISFVKILLSDTDACSVVQLTTYDADSVDRRDRESSDQQYADLQERWRRHYPGVPLQHSQLSKWGNRKIHDREIKAITRSGRTLVWDLGHGIDGVMSARHSCTVNFNEV